MTNVPPDAKPRNTLDTSRTADAPLHWTDIGQVHWVYSGQRWRDYLRDMLARQFPSEGQEIT